MKPRAKPGDVVTVEARGKIACLQYLGVHPLLGDTVLVAQAASTEPLAESLFDDGYVAFYPLRAAVSRGLVKIAGHLPLQTRVPERLRQMGMISRSGRVETWVIRDSNGERVETQLSDADRELPIASIWNHEMLLQRLAESWRPEKEP